MTFTPATLKGAYLVQPEPFSDERGWFARTYCKREFSAIGHIKEWVQLNHSFTRETGSIRGMHFQLPPHAEIKMVRCVAGAVWDVIVDIRQQSPTFLQWYATELSARNRSMLYIPEGFAHGFQTLEPDTELVYHHSEYYTPGAERGMLYNDPLINIQWPLRVTHVSARDQSHAALNESFKGI
jgi:dTDP-4-dehydrorhamnose 3,5-epimerase